MLNHGEVVLLNPFENCRSHDKIQKFIYKVGKNWREKHFKYGQQLKNLTLYFVYEFVTFCIAHTSVIYYAVLKTFNHFIR